MALPLLILLEEVMVTRLISLGLTIQQYTSYDYIHDSLTTLTLHLSEWTWTLRRSTCWLWESLMMMTSNSIDILQNLVNHARDTLVVWMDSLSRFCDGQILPLHDTMDVLPRLIRSISIDKHTRTHVSIVLILILIVLLINELYATYKAKPEHACQCQHQHQDPVYTPSAFIDEELQVAMGMEKEKDKDESGRAKSSTTASTPLLNSSSETLSLASSPVPSDESHSSSIIHKHNSRPCRPYPVAYIPYTDSLFSSSSASTYTPTFLWHEHNDDDDDLSIRVRSDDSDKQPVQALYALLRPPASFDTWPMHYTDALYDAIVNGTEIRLAKSIVAKDYVYGRIELANQSISLEELFERQWQGIRWVE